MAGRGVISLHINELKELLQLPEGFKPITAYYAQQAELVCLVVEHDAIEQIGSHMPMIDPVYERDDNGVVKLIDIKMSRI